MKKDKRINVRANDEMVNNLKLLKLYYDFTQDTNMSYSTVIALALVELKNKCKLNNNP